MMRMAQQRIMKHSPSLNWKVGADGDEQVKLQHKLNTAPRRFRQDVLFVGDSINTDIRTSIENGIDCALVCVRRRESPFCPG